MVDNRKAQLPEGFANFLQFYDRLEQPSVAQAYRDYRRVHRDQPLSIGQARRALKAVTLKQRGRI